MKGTVKTGQYLDLKPVLTAWHQEGHSLFPSGSFPPRSAPLGAGTGAVMQKARAWVRGWGGTRQ